MTSDRVLLAALLFISISGFFRIGYQMVVVAWYAVQITGSIAAAGQILFATSIAGLVAAPWIGRLIDSVVRKRVLILIGYFCTSSIVVGGFFVWKSGIAPQYGFFLLMIIAALTGVTAMLAAGGMDYFLKLCISSDQRLRSLALLNACNQIALICGAGMGGVALSVLEIESLLIFNAVLALIPALVALFALPDLRVKSGLIERTDIARSVMAGAWWKNFVLYARLPQLLMIAFCAALTLSVGQITNTLLPALVNLYWRRSSIDYSLVEVAWALGAFLAGLFLMQRIGAKEGRTKDDVLLIMLMASLLAVIPIGKSFFLLSGIHFFLGIGFSYIRIRNETRFLMYCPVALLGRFRANGMIINSLFGLGVYAVPTLAPQWSVPTLYWLFAITLFVCACGLLIFSRLTMIRDVSGEAGVIRPVSQEKV